MATRHLTRQVRVLCLSGKIKRKRKKKKNSRCSIYIHAQEQVNNGLTDRSINTFFSSFFGCIEKKKKKAHRVIYESAENVRSIHESRQEEWLDFLFFEKWYTTRLFIYLQIDIKTERKREQHYSSADSFAASIALLKPFSTPVSGNVSRNARPSSCRSFAVIARIIHTSVMKLSNSLMSRQSP